MLDTIVERGGKAEFLHLDLASLRSVRTAAEGFIERGHRLDCLIANAGIAGHRGTTEEGFELTFGVNHLGHFLLTNLLLPKLKESAPARVVVVSSGAHFRTGRGIDFEAVHRPTRTLTGFHEYCVSKLANVLFAAELARRLEGTGVTTYSLGPGYVASDVWRRIPWPVRPLMLAFMKSTEEGAMTQLYCATEPDLAAQSGKYYKSLEQKAPDPYALDESLAAELWDRSARWTAKWAAPIATPGAITAPSEESST